MSIYATLSDRTMGSIKENLKNILEELEILRGMAQIINEEHRPRLTSDDQGDLANLELWTSDNLTFIRRMNKDILSRSNKGNLTDREIMEEIVDLLYNFSMSTSVILGIEALHEGITELRADMRGEIL